MIFTLQGSVEDMWSSVHSHYLHFVGSVLKIYKFPYIGGHSE